MQEGNIIGLVTDGDFFPLDKKGKEVKVTKMSMQEASEITPMDLTEYEGKVIMISGHDAGDIIYNAKIIDVANPILSAIAMKVFGKS
jgi:hypothetical protein